MRDGGFSRAKDLPISKLCHMRNFGNTSVVGNNKRKGNARSAAPCIQGANLLSKEMMVDIRMYIRCLHRKGKVFPGLPLE